jgi:glutathione synthase/RimK-type ligase-like ATP-grasp enzyme
LKGLQLRIAAELGFRIPRFVITNEVKKAESFVKSCSEGVIVKTLAKAAILSQKRAATLYTHLLTESDLEHLFAVRFGPTFLQEFIKKSFDIRVTVIGNKLFAVGIESGNVERARVDFRRAEVYDLAHTILDIPQNLQIKCLDLVRALGLSFGAIDLLLTPAGDYVFLEINPNGQWYWLEWVTGIPLSKTMCDLLTGAMDYERSGSFSEASPKSTSPKCNTNLPLLF